MPDPAHLVLIRDGDAVHRLLIGPAGVRVGRAPDNDLVLSDGEISWGHAEFWATEGRVYVRDRGSTNGTFVNGWRVRVPLPVTDRDRVRLGSGVELRVEGGAGNAEDAPPTWLAEDLARGVVLPFSTMLPGEAPPDPTGRVRVGGHLVESGTAFEIAGRSYRVVRGEGAPVPTAGASSAGWPYRLVVKLDTPTGPEAQLQHRTSARKCRITAENRAVLLYILARRVVEDQRRSLPPEEVGWCSDEEVVMGVWGREGAAMDTNGLHVLLHRIRRDLETSGFDIGFLEKRNRAVRVALLDVTVE